MARIDDALYAALRELPNKPPDDSLPSKKKAYSEGMSKKLAEVFAEELRNRGLKETRPGSPGSVSISGAERQMAGGIGAKKVDVTWATEESGLLLHAAGYWLLDVLRTKLVGAGVERMQLDTLRLKLIKIGGRVRQLLTRVKLHLASSHPGQQLWYTLCEMAHE